MPSWDEYGNPIEDRSAPARPRPRQMRTPEARATDPNRGVREQAYEEIRSRPRAWDENGNEIQADIAMPTAPSRDIPDVQAVTRQPEQRGFIEGVANWFGGSQDRRQDGEGREAAWQGVPENREIENPVLRWLDAEGRAADVGLGFFLNRNEEERARIIRQHIPDAEFRRDEFGRLQTRYAPDRPWAYINAPGFSVQDIQGFANDVVRFAPAARFGGAAATLGGRAASSALATGATEAASQAAAMPLGAEEVDLGDVALAAGGGAAGSLAGDAVTAASQAIPQVVRRLTPRDPGDLRAGPVENVETGRVDLPAAARGAGRARAEMQAADAEAAQRAVRRGNDAAQAYEAAEEFNIPITRGQASGDARQIAREQRMARGGSGEEAERVMRGFEQRQNEALREGGTRLVTREGDALSDDIGSAGSAFRESMVERARDLEGKSDEAFRRAFELARETPISPSDELGARIQSVIDDGFFDAPGAQNVINRLQALITRGGANFSQVARARQALNRLHSDAVNARNGALAEATRSIRQELDAWTRETLQSSQAKQALQALEEANQTFSELRQLYGSGGRRDIGGTAIERVLDVETTGQQVAEAMLGVGNRPPKSALEAVRRVRQIATATTREGRMAQRPGATAGARRFNSATDQPSAELQALREATMHRVLSPTVRRQPGGAVPAQTIRTNLRDMLDGPGKEIAEELFTPRELAAMRRYLAIVEKLVPPVGTVNNSGTAYELSRMFQQITDQLWLSMFNRLPAIVFRAPVQTLQGNIGEALGKVAAQRATSRPIVEIDLMAAPNRAGTGASGAEAAGADD